MRNTGRVGRWRLGVPPQELWLTVARAGSARVGPSWSGGGGAPGQWPHLWRWRPPHGLGADGQQACGRGPGSQVPWVWSRAAQLGDGAVTRGCDPSRWWLLRLGCFAAAVMIQNMAYVAAAVTLGVAARGTLSSSDDFGDVHKMSLGGCSAWRGDWMLERRFRMVFSLASGPARMWFSARRN